MSLKIGIDFGGVLSIHDGEPIAVEHRSTAINMPNAIESLHLLKKLGHKLYLISFCGKTRAVQTKKSIDDNIPDLFEETYFVKSKKYKKDITKYVGCDIMIDDTLDILVDIEKTRSCPNNIWFKGDPTFDDPRKNPRNMKIISATSWPDVVKICSTCQPATEPDSMVDLNGKIYIV